MRWTIHATAAGAAVMCSALAYAGEIPVAGAPSDALEDEPPIPLVVPHLASDTSESAQAEALAPTTAFSWTSDISLTPPPYIAAAADNYLIPPSTSSTAIPLPPAAWTGFASLGGLAGIGLIRRLRRPR